MLNWKYSLVCAVAGLSTLVGLVWRIDDVSPFWCAWWIAAALCGYIVFITPVVGPWAPKARIHKAKVGVPSFLLGADAVMTLASAYGVWSSYYYGGNHAMVERAGVLLVSGLIAVLLVVIIRKVKALPSAA